MSERYQDCIRCKGKGLVKDPVLLLFEECSRCQGTGFEGDVFYSPEAKRDHDEAMRAAIEALNRHHKKEEK